MKVKEIMTANPQSCGPDVTLDAAAHAMWEADCGILPVQDNGKLVGVVTDRDMYIALAAGAMKWIGTEAVVETLQAICAHTRRKPHTAAA